MSSKKKGGKKGDKEKKEKKPKKEKKSKKKVVEDGELVCSGGYLQLSRASQTKTMWI